MNDKCLICESEDIYDFFFVDNEYGEMKISLCLSCYKKHCAGYENFTEEKTKEMFKFLDEKLKEQEI